MLFVNKLEPFDLKSKVKSEIMRYIHQMDLNSNNKLPREETFCKMLGISRVTLRATLDELAGQGVIFRRHGKGTFVNVCSLDIKVSFSPVMDFYDMISFSGYTPGMELIESHRMPAPEHIAKAMDINPGQEIYFIKKVFFADKRFCAYVEDYLNLTILSEPQKLDDLPLDRPIFSLLSEEFDIHVKWDKVEIDVLQSNAIHSLKSLIERGVCRDAPLLLLKGINFDEQDRPIIYGLEYIDTELIKFSQIRKRGSV